MKMLNRLYIFSCYFTLFVFNNALSQYKYDLAVCAIFKNEARFLKEWIEFYKLIGVEHFYLYNNFSNDNYQDVLQPYINSKDVKFLIGMFHLR